MRRVLPTLLLAPLAILATATTASIGRPASKPQESTESVLKAYNEDYFAHRYDRALSDIKDLKADPDNVVGRALLAAMRANVLLVLKRNSEAQQLIAQVRQIGAQDPSPDQTLFLGGVFSDRFDVAADALDNMIARYPDAARDQDLGLIRYYFSKAPSGQRTDDQRIALAKLGYGGDTETGHYFTFEALKLLVQRGDITGARSVVGYIGEPQLVEDLLIDKRFAALWPDAAEVAGPHLSKIDNASVQSALRFLDQSPDDDTALPNLADAYLHAGRLNDAIALKEKLPRTSADMSKAGEQTGWTVNDVALAMHAAGDREGADRLFGLLNNAPMPKENWRVSMKINRLELLVQDGKYDRALPLIEPTAQTDGSDYAKQLVRRLRYCTYAGLGRTADAAKLLPELLVHAKDAYAPTIDGLLCGGQFETAEKVALDALAADKNGDFEQNFLRQLQAVPLSSDDPSNWTKQWAEFRKRPAIAATFDRLGRDMPSDYLQETGGTK